MKKCKKLLALLLAVTMILPGSIFTSAVMAATENVAAVEGTGDVLYSADFNSLDEFDVYYGPTAGAWSASEGTARIDGGNGNKAVAKNQTFTDFVLEADVTVERQADMQDKSSCQGGLLFRVSQAQGGQADGYYGYYFCIDAGGQRVTIGRSSGNNWYEIATKKMTIKWGVPYHVTITVKDNHITCYVDYNGENYAKIDVLDSTHASGSVGMRNWLSHTSYQNLKVSEYTETALGEDESYTNPLMNYCADPDVLYHNGTYFLYPTNAGQANQGIKVYTSTDLVNWTDRGYAFAKGDGWGESGFWAPDIFERDGVFYMYYVANEQICVATSESPLGPFKQDVYEPMDTATATYTDSREIDAHVFYDEASGKYYFYCVRFTGGNVIWGAELNDDMKTIKKETLTQILAADQGWDQDMGNINEGPFMLVKDGVYYMTYSGAHFQSTQYGSGYAVSDSPLGPFTKYENNPIMQSNTQVHGAGHHCVTTSPDGKEMFMVYHCHHDLSNTEPRQLCIDRMQFTTDEDGVTVLEVKGPTITPQAIPSGAADVENFINFNKIEDILVPVGTPVEDIEAVLPANVTMYTSKSEYTLPVTWDISAYDSANSGTVAIEGTIEVPDGVVGDYYQNASFTPVVKVVSGKQILHYEMKETEGTTVADSIGSYDGTLVGNTSWVSGLEASAVQLAGGEDYIQVPAEALTQSEAVTISAWVKPEKVDTWTTLFSAGSGQDNYAIFAAKGTPDNNEVGLTLAIIEKGSAEYRVAAPAGVTLPVGEWSLVTYSQSGTTATLYINGRQVAKTDDMQATIKGVMEASADAEARIGDNHIWPDPSFEGSVAEVWVLGHAITDNELAEEMAAKEDIVHTVTIDDAAELFTLGDTSHVTSDLELPEEFRGAQIRWSSSDGSVVAANGSITRPSSEDKTVTLTAVFYRDGSDYTKTLEFTVTVPALTAAEKAASQILHYKLNEGAGTTVEDSVSSYDGTLVGNTSWVEGISGSAVQLAGGVDYISVPNGALTHSDTVTVSMWMKIDEISNWTSLFTAGSAQNNYVIFAAQGDPGGQRIGLTMAIKENGAAEYRVSAPAGVTLPIGEWALVTYTQTGTTATLYLNGEMVGQMNDMQGSIKGVIEASANSDVRIGDNNIWPDPSVKGAVSEVWILNRAITAEELKAEVKLKTEGPVLPYTDVAEDAWYYDVVYYNYAAGYMTGKDATTFAPDETLTRAELTSILYRINGEPEVEYEAVFSDVAEDAWYASPVLWAYENKVVSGYAEGDFRPDNAITREQLAVIMHNYAAAKDYEADASVELGAFNDADQVGDWAKPAVQWAVATGIISGKDGVSLDPQGNATRAEAAAIIQRFMENIAK